MKQLLKLRWLHVRGVSETARRLAAVCDLDAEHLVASAWLHDLWVSAGVREHRSPRSRWSPGRRASGFPTEAVRLVAYHSLAQVEADLRGLGDVLRSEFRLPAPQLADALCYCAHGERAVRPARDGRTSQPVNNRRAA